MSKTKILRAVFEISRFYWSRFVCAKSLNKGAFKICLYIYDKMHMFPKNCKNWYLVTMYNFFHKNTNFHFSKKNGLNQNKTLTCVIWYLILLRFYCDKPIRIRISVNKLYVLTNRNPRKNKPVFWKWQKSAFRTKKPGQPTVKYHVNNNTLYWAKL